MNDSIQIQEESIQPPIHTKGELQRPKKRKRLREIESKNEDTDRKVDQELFPNKRRTEAKPASSASRFADCPLIADADKAFKYFESNHRNANKRLKLIATLESITDDLFLILRPEWVGVGAVCARRLCIHYLKGCKTPGCKTELRSDSVPAKRHKVLLTMTAEELQAAKPTQCQDHRTQACQEFLFQILQQNPFSLVPVSDIHHRGLKDHKFSKIEIQLACRDMVGARADIVGGTMYLWKESPETKIEMEDLIRQTEAGSLIPQDSQRSEDASNQTTSKAAEGPKVNLLNLPSDITTQIVHQLNCADMSSLSRSCQFGRKAVKDACGPFVVLRVGV